VKLFLTFRATTTSTMEKAPAATPTWAAWLGALLELLYEVLLGERQLPRTRLMTSSRAVDKTRIVSARNANGNTAFIDGAVLSDGQCGVAIYYVAGHTLNTHGRLELPDGAPSDSNLTELAALAHCLLRHPRHQPLTVFSDSAHALRCTEAIAAPDAVQGGGARRKRGEAKSGVAATGAATPPRTANDPTRDPRWGALVLLIHLLLRLRRGPTSLYRVPAHKGWKPNETADALAQKGAAEGANILPLPAAGASDRSLARWVIAASWSLHYLCTQRAAGEVDTGRPHAAHGGSTRGVGSGSGGAAGFARRDPARRDSRRSGNGGGGNGRSRSGRDEALVLPPPRPRVGVGSGAAPTGVLAVDCEMVGVGTSGLDSKLASVCVVNEHLE